MKEYTEEQIRALQVIADADFDLKDSIRSVLHSAAIKKGYVQPKLVQNEMSKVSGIIRNDREVFVGYTDIDLPPGYSQTSGHTVDNFIEFKNQILLIDPKSAGHNNNTPISDVVTKMNFAKQQVQIDNPTKKVRFILLKPNDVNPNDFDRLLIEFGKCGIELFITDEFLSQMRNEKVDVSSTLKQVKSELMSEGIRSLIPK
jgi:hypothetical protein